MTVESVLKGFTHYVQAHLPGGFAVALAAYLIFDFGVVVFLFAMIFKYLPDAKIRWVGAAIRALLSVSANGPSAFTSAAAQRLLPTARPARSSPCSCGFYYSSQILLLVAEFTQVYADYRGGHIEPDEHAVSVERQVIEKT